VACLAVLAWLVPIVRAFSQAGPLPAATTATDELFAKIYPVFAHPRCANCHGVVEHYPGFTHSVTPETHPGGEAGGGLPNPTVECTQCHDDVDDAWQVTAPPNMEWAGLAEEQVCVMQAAEVRLKNKEAGGEGAGTEKSYLHHLASDPLIAQAFLGWAGGARPKQIDGKPQAPLPVPPLTYAKFIAAAKEWVDAGAPCKAMGEISHVEDQKTAYTVAAAGGKVSFQQNARREVNIVRRGDGSATATIMASGWDETVRTLDAGGCEIVTRVRNQWTRTGSPQVAAEVRVEVKPDEYTIHIVLPDEETTHTVSTTTQTNTCGAPSPAIPADSADLTWPSWEMTLRCPTEFPKHDGTMGCLPSEPHEIGATDGALHQTVTGASDAGEPRSWLYGSPMAIARVDTGEGLPVHVKVTWALRLDQK
jgi:hypothetical protein